MGVGYGANKNKLPKLAAKISINSGCSYEMVDRYGWHYVRPLTMCYSLMVTGKPWSKKKSNKIPLAPLEENVKNELIKDFMMTIDPLRVLLPHVDFDKEDKNELDLSSFPPELFDAISESDN